MHNQISLPGIVFILLKGRMGNKLAPEGPKYLQSPNASLTIQTLASDTDPLRKYINHHPSFNVKTLADVQNSNSKVIFTKNTQKILMKKNTQPFTPSGNIQNNSNTLTALNTRFSCQISSTVPQRPPRRNTDAEMQFKTISISQETFMKIRKQSPETYYEMKEKIGQGSYGQVFRAVHRKTQEQRAIKVLKVGLMRQQKRKEFLAEMTLLSKLNHPSIITLYQLFANGGQYYVVMEYCRGGTMGEILGRLRNQSQALIANIMKQLLSALAYMHSLNIIHRDIKLDNVVFLPSAEHSISIKIIDFGTAVQSTNKVVHKYPIAGTLSYLAPEVLAQVLTERSDIWSSAVIMFILLTGTSPFKAKNEQETKRKILKKALKYNQKPLKDISDEAKDLLKLMLNRSIEDRISAVDALQHRWLSTSSENRPMSSTNLQQLSLYYRRNNFISLIESYLVLRRITQQERQRLAQMFNNIDSDANGLISREELISIFQKHSEGHYSASQVEAIANSIDINNSGKIDFNQFIIAMYDRRKLYLKESLNEAFDHFDIDHTGFIEMQELREMLKGGDQAQVAYIFQVMDKDSDARISREQFVQYLLSE